MKEERGITVSPPQGRASRPKHVVHARAGGVCIKGYARGWRLFILLRPCHLAKSIARRRSRPSSRACRRRRRSGRKLGRPSEGHEGRGEGTPALVRTSG